jgi:hypothetical protein
MTPSPHRDGAMSSKIMYIEKTRDGGATEWARVGRVSFSKSGRTLYYRDLTLAGEGRAWYRDPESGDSYWIQRARADGRDRGGKDKRGSFPVEIDDDVREEYWNEVRGEPTRSHERIIHA